MINSLLVNIHSTGNNIHPTKEGSEGSSMYTKKRRELGIRECIIWNEAAIAKYVWHIANKENILWVKWVNHIYLKWDNLSQ